MPYVDKGEDLSLKNNKKTPLTVGPDHAPTEINDKTPIDNGR